MAGTPRTAPEDRGGSMSRDGRPDPATEAFLTHRNLLFTVAYELLGSAADAEDVLQETWLRWAGVDLGTVQDQRAYLVRITTRQALTRLRALGRRKESYVGPWLPEPLLTAPDVAEDVELADSVSMAMLLVLETLTPAERAVFVLREVFDLAVEADDQRRVAVDLGRLQRGRGGGDPAQPDGQQAGHPADPHDGHLRGLHDSAAVAQEDDVRREDVEQLLQVARFGRPLEGLKRVPGLGGGNRPARSACRDV